VLPELCNTGYLFKSRKELYDFAEPVPSGETIQTFLSLARKRNLSIIFGLAERDRKKVYNSSVFISPRGKITTYRKAHLFLEEKFIFDPGNTGFRAFNWGDIKIGMLICFDWIFPEAARSLALTGAQIICHPANLILHYAESVTVSRAIENRVFYIMANRTGAEKRGKKVLQFTGRSQIISPSGEVLAKATNDEEAVEIVNIDPIKAKNKFVTRYNDIFKDRRRKLYYI
ncbi:MAG: acyltransferase, partial [Ignavibacteria bacterium]|nr:acyltransferase [Ignavibacteria bacterium]